MEEITELAGYRFVDDLERELLTEEQLDQKYRAGEREYVIRKRKEEATR
jgi:hypothetical protein